MISLLNLPLRCQQLSPARPKKETPTSSKIQGLKKIQNRPQGRRNIGAPLHPCQEISGLVPIFNRTRDLLEYLLHIPLCMLEPRFCPRSGALLFRPVPLSNSIVSRLLCSSLARRLPACVSFSLRSAGPDPRGCAVTPTDDQAVGLRR